MQLQTNKYIPHFLINIKQNLWMLINLTDVISCNFLKSPVYLCFPDLQIFSSSFNSFLQNRRTFHLPLASVDSLYSTYHRQKNTFFELLIICTSLFSAQILTLAVVYIRTLNYICLNTTFNFHWIAPFPLFTWFTMKSPFMGHFSKWKLLYTSLKNGWNEIMMLNLS